MKKLLAILMVLCMILPMAAFAEEAACTHEGTTEEWTYISDPEYEDQGESGHMLTGPLVREVYCYNCGEYVETEVVEEETSELRNHEYDPDGICYECGHENTCTHSSTYSYWDVDHSEAVFTDVGDDSYHEAKGTVYEYTYCDQCYQLISCEETGEDTLYESHEYDSDGVCYYCGHVNACAHKNTTCWVSFAEDWTDLRYAPSNDNQHRVTGLGYVYTYCMDCGMYLGCELKEAADYWNHNWDGTVCTLCGYDRAAAKEEEAAEEKAEEPAEEKAEESIDLGAFADILGAFGKELCGQDVDTDAKANGTDLDVTFKLKEQAGEDAVKEMADKLTAALGDNAVLLKVKDAIEKIGAAGLDVEKIALALKFVNADDSAVFDKTVTYADVKDLKAE